MVEIATTDRRWWKWIQTEMDKLDWHHDGGVDGDDFPLIDHDGRDRNLRSLVLLWIGE
jgi:hypothetical protein